MNWPIRPTARGFTLLEILVALVIFSLMSLLAYRGLNTVLQTRAHLTQDNQKWRDVAMLFARLEKDFAMLAPRPIRDQNNLRAAPLLGKASLQNDQDAHLQLTRMGIPEQADSLAGPLRFAYRLRESRIEQLVWPVLDAAPRSSPSVNPLLTQVAKLDIQYLDRTGQWHDHWPLNESSNAFPSAVQISIELNTQERVTRLFALPALQ